MQNVPSLIILLPALGFLFNAFFGKRVGPRVVSIVAPGVVLAAFLVALYTLFYVLPPAPQHAAEGAEQAAAAMPHLRNVIVPLIPFTPADTPWINAGGFRVNFALLIDPLSMLM